MLFMVKCGLCLPCLYMFCVILLFTVTARSKALLTKTKMMQRNGEIKFWEAECLKVDAINKKVICRSNANENLPGKNDFSLEYDYLVVAVGAQVNTFNTPGVSENCYFLKVVSLFAQKRKYNFVVY